LLVYSAQNDTTLDGESSGIFLPVCTRCRIEAVERLVSEQ